MKILLNHPPLIRLLFILVSLSAALTSAASAQSYAPPSPFANAQPAYTQQELDQILAPIALYPDALLSQILMASTYPLEVVQAARWSRANPGLQGDDAVRAVADQDWDPSVKSLVAFPQILSMMDEKLDWTQRLGDAFLAHQPQLMDTVQNLRQRAYAVGNLRSNEQIRVEPQEQIIAIEPANSQFVYVPYYDPAVVYGPWWWPEYPPVYWTPWPGYYARPGYSAGFAWGRGISISSGFFFGGFDWRQHRTRVVNANNYYSNRTASVNRQSSAASVPGNVNAAPGVWYHDPAHRRGVPYREALVRQPSGSASGASAAWREIRAREAQSRAVLAAPPNRSDARVANAGAQTFNTDPRRDGRGADSNLPDARVSGRPNWRGTDNNPGAARTRENRPETRAIGRPDVRTGFGNGSDMRSNRSAAPDAVVRPNVERQPSAIEGAGRRVDARNFSPRGPDRAQAAPISRTYVPAPTPPAPPSLASRPARIQPGPASPSANPRVRGENSRNPESAGKRS